MVIFGFRKPNSYYFVIFLEFVNLFHIHVMLVFTICLAKSFVLSSNPKFVGNPLSWNKHLSILQLFFLSFYHTIMLYIQFHY